MEPMVKTKEPTKMMSTSQTTMATTRLLTMRKPILQPLKTQQAARSKHSPWLLLPWMKSPRPCRWAKVLVRLTTRMKLLQRPIKGLGLPIPQAQMPQQQKTLNKNKLNKIIKLRIEFKFERVTGAGEGPKKSCGVSFHRASYFTKYFFTVSLLL